MNSDKFTLNYYRTLLSELLNQNYSFIYYDETRNNTEKVCILRHDVDFDLDKAVYISHFEKGVNTKIKSVFFILLSSDFYNVSSKKSLDSIKKILNSNNEIGLHFDEIKYKGEINKENFSKIVINEAKLLSQAIGHKIKFVSMHRPSKWVLESDLNIGPLVNSYSKEFLKDYKYITDSRKMWKENPLEVIQSPSNLRLHLLTHPFWYSEKEQSIKNQFIELLQKLRKSNINSLIDNFTNIEEFFNEKEICE